MIECVSIHNFRLTPITARVRHGSRKFATGDVIVAVDSAGWVGPVLVEAVRVCPEDRIYDLVDLTMCGDLKKVL